MEKIVVVDVEEIVLELVQEAAKGLVRRVALLIVKMIVVVDVKETVLELVKIVVRGLAKEVVRTDAT